MFEVMRNFHENEMLMDFINSNILNKQQQEAYLKLCKEAGGKGRNPVLFFQLSRYFNHQLANHNLKLERTSIVF